MVSQTKEDKLRGVGTESCESERFVVIVDKEYDEEDEKITNLVNAKLSMSFFLANNFFISDILVPMHALTAETLKVALQWLELILQTVSVQKKL